MNFLKTKLTALILVVVLIGLLGGCRQDIIYTDKPLVIEKVEISDKRGGKYKYTTHDSNNECIFYLDEKYQIGDTLIVKKP